MQNTTSANRSDYPVSPCISICTLDDADVCIGCRRTVEEIVAWGRMTADEQRAVIADLSRRAG